MAKSQNSKISRVVSRLTPQCGVTGALTIFGCVMTVYFTDKFKWSPWEFGTVFTGILVPGKGIKILDSMVTTRRGGKK